MNFLQAAKTIQAETRPDNRLLISQILCHISKWTRMMVYLRQTPPFSSVFKVPLASEAFNRVLHSLDITKNRIMSEMVDNPWLRRHRLLRFKISLMRIQRLVVHSRVKNLVWTLRKSRKTTLASGISFSNKIITLVELMVTIVASLLPLKPETWDRLLLDKLKVGLDLLPLLVSVHQHTLRCITQQRFSQTHRRISYYKVHTQMEKRHRRNFE